VSFAFTGIGMFGVFLFLTYYLEGTLAYSPVVTGAAFLPFVGGILLSSNGGAALLQPRLGRRGLMAAGMLTSAVGLVLLTQIGIHSAYATHVLPGTVLVGLGIGAVFPPGLDLATSGVSDEDAGAASAMINVTQQVGGSIGMALLNTIAATAAAGFVGSAGAAAVHSYVVVFWWGAAIFAVGAVVTRLLLPRDQA
jgi:MFS family permease